MAKTVAFISHKGGVGKTTLSVNFSYFLSEILGKRVCLIDMDPQGGASFYITQRNPKALPNLTGELLLLKYPPQGIRATSNLTLYTANENLILSKKELENKLVGKEKRLLKAVERLENNFDYFVVDTPPDLSLLTVNAIVASEAVVFPARMGYLELLAIPSLYELISDIEDELGKEIKKFVIPNGVREEIPKLKEIFLKEVKSLSEFGFHILPPLKERAAFKYSSGAGKPVWEFMKKKKEDKEMVFNVFEELFKLLEQKVGGKV